MVALLVFGSLVGVCLVCVMISAAVSALVRRRQTKRLENAKRKLGVATVQQAVAKGLMYDIISI